MDIFDSHKSRLIQIGMLETHRSLLWSNINKNNNKFKAVLYINKVSCSWWWSNHIKRWTGFACILLSTRQGSEFMPVNLCWRRSRQKICTWLLPQCGLYLHILCFHLLLFCPLPNYTLVCWRQNTDQYRMYTVNSYCNDTRRIDTKLRSKSYPITDCCYILQGCSQCFQISLSRSLFFARVHLSIVPEAVPQLPAFIVLVSLRLLPVQYLWVTFSGKFVVPSLDMIVTSYTQ